jgi:hypothetical protein
MRELFAVLPDRPAAPRACFTELEDAIEWGLQRHGSDKFVIRLLSIREAYLHGETNLGGADAS